VRKRAHVLLRERGDPPGEGCRFDWHPGRSTRITAFIAQREAVHGGSPTAGARPDRRARPIERGRAATWRPEAFKAVTRRRRRRATRAAPRSTTSALPPAFSCGEAGRPRSHAGSPRSRVTNESPRRRVFVQPVRLAPEAAQTLEAHHLGLDVHGALALPPAPSSRSSPVPPARTSRAKSDTPGLAVAITKGRPARSVLHYVLRDALVVDRRLYSRESCRRRAYREHLHHPSSSVY
jgi:hypothetical protein